MAMTRRKSIVGAESGKGKKGYAQDDRAEKAKKPVVAQVPEEGKSGWQPERSERERTKTTGEK